MIRGESMQYPADSAHRRHPQTLGIVGCTECGLEADERFTIAEHWTWWSDGCGGLLPFCPDCAEREFGHRTAYLDGSRP